MTWRSDATILMRGAIFQDWEDFRRVGTKSIASRNVLITLMVKVLSWPSTNSKSWV